MPFYTAYSRRNNYVKFLPSTLCRQRLAGAAHATPTRRNGPMNKPMYPVGWAGWTGNVAFAGQPSRTMVCRWALQAHRFARRCLQLPSTTELADACPPTARHSHAYSTAPADATFPITQRHRTYPARCASPRLSPRHPHRGLLQTAPPRDKTFMSPGGALVAMDAATLVADKQLLV